MCLVPDYTFPMHFLTPFDGRRTDEKEEQVQEEQEEEEEEEGRLETP